MENIKKWCEIESYLKRYITKYWNILAVKSNGDKEFIGKFHRISMNITKYNVHIKTRLKIIYSDSNETPFDIEIMKGYVE